MPTKKKRIGEKCEPKNRRTVASEKKRTCNQPGGEDPKGGFCAREGKTHQKGVRLFSRNEE